MARWQGMETAPRDRAFLVCLSDGHVTRARLIEGKLASVSYDDESARGIAWQELPPPLKVKGARRSNDYTPEFLAFYAGFPGRKGESKFDAFKAWRALGPTQQAQAIEAKPLYVAICSRKDPDFFPATAVWLRGRRFETLLAGRDLPPNGEAPAETPEVWLRRIGLYRRTSNWNVAYGPAPGKPGCRVPVDILAQAGLITV